MVLVNFLWIAADGVQMLSPSNPERHPCQIVRIPHTFLLGCLGSNQCQAIIQIKPDSDFITLREIKGTGAIFAKESTFDLANSATM